MPKDVRIDELRVGSWIAWSTPDPIGDEGDFVDLAEVTVHRLTYQRRDYGERKRFHVEVYWHDVSQTYDFEAFGDEPASLVEHIERCDRCGWVYEVDGPGCQWHGDGLH